MKACLNKEGPAQPRCVPQHLVPPCPDLLCQPYCASPFVPSPSALSPSISSPFVPGPTILVKQKKLAELKERSDLYWGTDEYFAELLDATEYSNMTKAEREAYNRRLKILRDNYAADKYACEKQEEMEKGRAEGMMEGRAEANRDNALKMLRDGLPVDLSRRVTGLSESELNGLP